MEDESAQGLVTEVFDEQGRLLGAFVAKSLWERLKHDAVLAASALASPPKSGPAEGIAEPLADWETLVACWDFQYPVDYSVHCGVCGTATAHWQQDQPRKFRLTTASLGGLVAFTCQQCAARVTKKHFKDHIHVETTASNAAPPH